MVEMLNLVFWKDEDEYATKKGFVAGWFDSPPIPQDNPKVFEKDDAIHLSNSLHRSQEKLRFLSRVSGVEKLDKCEDPETQKNPDGSRVNTYYPPGTTCYVDPSFGRERHIKLPITKIY